MKTNKILMLGLVLALLLSASITLSGSAKGAEVPFHAYYAVFAESVTVPCDPGLPRICNVQTFTPGGVSNVMHLGMSKFSGEATVFLPLLPSFPPPPVQIGTGIFTADNGDELYISYVGNVRPVADNPGHVVTEGTFEFEGGSGRFEGVSGGGTYRVFAHVHPNPEAPNDLWFDGELKK